jgi:tetratricopeptide (TPR) repeat protein
MKSERWELLGNLHPSVTQTINDLAFLYQVMGKWTESEALMREAMELDIKMLGEEHPNISTNWYSLGSLLHKTGKYDEAEELLTIIQLYNKWNKPKQADEFEIYSSNKNQSELYNSSKLISLDLTAG